MGKEGDGGGRGAERSGEMMEGRGEEGWVRGKWGGVGMIEVWGGVNRVDGPGVV